jgi:hypothetical protein
MSGLPGCDASRNKPAEGKVVGKRALAHDFAEA